MKYHEVPIAALIAPGCKALRPSIECKIKKYSYALEEILGVVYFKGSESEIFKIALILMDM
ncbi:hypothetical protein F1645_01475 [Novacetimonas hansenii]|uniref:Uncharacterized protein n=1 Tax=Novacetimonas hansenii TaxID=436 RepID=A0ABQ0SIK0_NOVHA|nr:hypothetical protein [Novacetimonas hansenii]GBQ52967.1 hypothetical protein AA0243_0194 [Novacetimonas hansenii NRIC 0243]GEC65051.1 hypothetical protein GHA01_29000 [Novacetimonas hansenii]